jgi:glycosyltransferase involved in cell wall biosynthesis
LTRYRILAVAATPFFVDRGGHIHIYEPIRALQKLGHEVTLVTYHIGRDVPDLDIRRIPNVPWYTKLDAGPSYRKLYLAWLMLRKTLQVVEEIKPDILHAHGWDSMWVAWWVWKLKGIPFVFDMQGSFSGEIAEHGYARKGGLYYKLLAFFEWLSLKASPTVVTSTSQIYEQARYRFGLDEDHLIPILDGVDTDIFSPENFPPDPALRTRLGLPDKPLVVFMGLLKTYQGVDDMLEAVRILVYERGFTDFHFLVIGFPDEDYYRQQAVEKGIGEYMTFTGKVPYHETGKYLTLADLAIAPKISPTEGDGKVYFYMAMGLPVVTYKRPASQEILGELGIYANFHDPVDLARALHETLLNPTLMKERGIANRHKAVNEYSWMAVARRIVEAYDLTMQRMKSSRVMAHEVSNE